MPRQADRERRLATCARRERTAQGLQSFGPVVRERRDGDREAPGREHGEHRGARRARDRRQRAGVHGHGEREHEAGLYQRRPMPVDRDAAQQQRESEGGEGEL